MTQHTFSKRVTLPTSAQEAFAWHERPGALDRLIPPWEHVRVSQRGSGIGDGSRVELENRLGPFRFHWLAEHTDYQPGRQFRDVQLSGPFALWEHEHRFEADLSGTSTLEDEVQYEVPGGRLGDLLGGRMIRDRIERMFDYRHATTRADLAAHARHQHQGTRHVAISGASGLVGSALVPFLTTGGHRVTRLVRRAAGAAEVRWDPQAEHFDAEELAGVDAVVHLAGENIAGGRWNPARKERIRTSRVNATRTLCEGLARMEKPPQVLVCASAVGYYGDRGDELLDEDSPAGDGFLTDVAQAWEAATRPAAEAGIRVVTLRLGMVLSPKGGALAKMLTPFRRGLGGRVGSGEQFWSWIAVDDAVGAIHHALMDSRLSGPVNAVAPEAVSNRRFTQVLGRVLRRPTIAPLPAPLARLVLGEMADALLLASIRVQPRRLLDTGYDFRQPTLEAALCHLLGRRNP